MRNWWRRIRCETIFDIYCVENKIWRWCCDFYNYCRDFGITKLIYAETESLLTATSRSSLTANNWVVSMSPCFSAQSTAISSAFTTSLNVSLAVLENIIELLFWLLLNSLLEMLDAKWNYKIVDWHNNNKKKKILFMLFQFYHNQRERITFYNRIIF